MPLFGAHRAELLKLRRSAALLVTMISPYLVVLAFGLFTWIEGSRFLHAVNVSSWQWLTDAVLATWCLLVLPLSSGLTIAHCSQLEHQAQGFKHLFALPTPRWHVYLAKLTTAWLLVACSFALLVAGLLASGLLLRWLQPGLGFEAPIPWGYLVGASGGGFLASLFFVSILQWVALERWRLAGPLGLTLLALALLLALRSFGSDLELFHPWAYPSLAAAAWKAGTSHLYWPLAGALGGGLFSLLAGAVFIRRDVH